jgi:hypothetical protein
MTMFPRVVKLPVAFVDDHFQDVLEQLASLLDSQLRIEMLHEVWQSHHQVVEDVRPDVDARNNFLPETLQKKTFFPRHRR